MKLDSKAFFKFYVHEMFKIVNLFFQHYTVAKGRDLLLLQDDNMFCLYV